MPQDYDVTRQVWEGKVPVEFVLAAHECTIIDAPKPYYAMLPRISYFPLALERAYKYFMSAVDESEVNKDDVWLEYDGYPLKWHYPVGVLFDLHKTDDVLPWQITVHLKKFPEDDIIRCAGRDALESMFMQSLKEADQLKHRGEIVNTMQKRDHKQLWNGLVNDRFDQFWLVNKKLMENSGSNTFHFVPMRLYKTDKPYRQVLVKPMNEAAERTTLAEACRIFDPDFDSSSSRVVSHGVEVPLDTPVIWLAENLAYPDNFVHISILSS
uniref:Autophagy protein 5 n=1 Tax=Plectus sambesii TaxID=2011161 RepID=A0A914X3Q0_9BILA